MHRIANTTIVLVLTLVIVARLTADCDAADETSPRLFRAGAAIADITPPLGEQIVGGFAPIPATAIHDHLHARCLVLDNGQSKIAWVICDNLGISREIYDGARALIAKETEFPPEHILMAATHTHSGTRARSERYRDTVIRGIASSVRDAIRNLQPAVIGWGGVDEPSEVFNRRWYVTDPELLKNPFGGIDQVRMNPPRGNPALVKPAGPIDPEISFISVQTVDRKPLALWANNSIHYVGGVNKGDISADYFGIFANRIGELLAADSDTFVGIMSNGTSGDINNINFRINSRDQGQHYERYEKMTEVAEKVAQRVKQAHDKIVFRDWVELGTASRELTLRRRKPDQAMQQYFAGVMAKPEDAEKHHRYERNYADRVKQLLEGPDEVSIPLQVMRVGDLAIAAIPFETFAEIGLEIKDQTPFADSFTIELANDYHGYLPTPRHHELGGYETWMGTNKVQLDASEQITAAILDLMQVLAK